MRRVVVIGTSGSGKTTFARALAAAMGAASLELDAVHHLPDWEPIPVEQFRAEVSAFIRQHDAWVVDGNYSALRDLLWTAADTVIWLDLSRSRVMWRVIARSIRRVATRQELWNGNREQLRNLASRDPERSVIRWAWVTFDVRRRELPEILADPHWQPLKVHRLRRPQEVRTFLTRGAVN